MRGGLGLRTLLYVDAPSAWQIAVGSVTTKKSKQPELPVVHAAQTLPHISFIFIFMEPYEERTIKMLDEIPP